MAAPPRDTSVVLYEFYGLPHHADDLSLAGHLVQRLSDAVATWGPELAVLGERAPLWEEPGAVDSLPAPQGDIPQTYLALAAESPREGCEYAEVVLYRAHDVMGIQLLVYSAARDADELRTLADAWLPEAKPADDTAAVLLGRTTLVHYVVDDEPSDAEDAARPSPGELHVATRAGGLSVTDDSPGRREYLLLTPKSLEDAAAAVVQWSGRPDQLHLFPALEMSRCKTAYEASEYAAAKTTLAVTERKLSQLRRETVHGDMGGRGRMADLLRECVDEPRGRGARALTESLCHLISVHGGLANQLSWLDDLARSIEVNAINFERAATALRAGRGDEADLFAQDAAVMQQQLEQLSTDMGYRRSVAARASHAVDSARA
ncbi:MAG: hypothetical protein ACE5JM_12915, partial [Armatimonadota bacterium]